jgi:hypothetical protein
VKASFSHALKTATFAGGKQEFLLGKTRFFAPKIDTKAAEKGPAEPRFPSVKPAISMTYDGFSFRERPFDKLKGRLLRPLRGASGRGLGEHPFRRGKRKRRRWFRKGWT